MSEQSCSAKNRPYRKAKRAADEQRTRARIVDAAETLHGTVGPAHTTVSAVAQQAGVTRATVYRHFPDEESLFLACSAQWLSRQRLPDPDAWAEGDPLDRLRRGLTDIYRYYGAAEPMLTLVSRDAESVPGPVREARHTVERHWLDQLLRPFPHRRKALRAAVAHAASFGTWRSLCVEQRLSDASAVELMVAMVTCASTLGRATTT